MTIGLHRYHHPSCKVCVCNVCGFVCVYQGASQNVWGLVRPGSEVGARNRPLVSLPDWIAQKENCLLTTRSGFFQEIVSQNLFPNQTNTRMVSPKRNSGSAFVDVLGRLGGRPEPGRRISNFFVARLGTDRKPSYFSAVHLGWERSSPPG